MSIQRATYSVIMGLSDKKEINVRSSETEQIMDEIKESRDLKKNKESYQKEDRYSYESLVKLDPSLEYEEKDDLKNKTKEKNKKGFEKEKDIEKDSEKFLEKRPLNNQKELIEKEKKQKKKKDEKNEDPLLKQNEEERTTLRAGNSLHASQSIGRPIDNLMQEIDQFETVSEMVQDEIEGEESVFDIHLTETSKEVFNKDVVGELNDNIYQSQKTYELESDHFDYPSLGDDVFENEKELTKKYSSN